MPNALEFQGLAIIGAIMFGYIALLRVLANVLYPMRDRLFSLGEQLCQDPKLPEHTKDFVEHALALSLSYRGAMLWSLACVIVIVRSIGQAIGLTAALTTSKVPEELEADVDEFDRLFLRSLFAANPFFGVLSYALTVLAFAVHALLRPFYLQEARQLVIETTLAQAMVDPRFRTAD